LLWNQYLGFNHDDIQENREREIVLQTV